jgi:hypothetical protein
MENLEIQLFRPPVAVAVPAPKWALLGHVIHHCLLARLRDFHAVPRADKLPNAAHQVKLTLVMAAVRFSDG